ESATPTGGTRRSRTCASSTRRRARLRRDRGRRPQRAPAAPPAARGSALPRRSHPAKPHRPRPAPTRCRAGRTLRSRTARGPGQPVAAPVPPCEAAAMPPAPAVRLAGPDDCPAVGRLLNAFNREFDEPTPEPEVLAERIRELLAADELTVLLAAADDG